MVSTSLDEHLEGGQWRRHEVKVAGAGTPAKWNRVITPCPARALAAFTAPGWQVDGEATRARVCTLGCGPGGLYRLDAGELDPTYRNHRLDLAGLDVAASMSRSRGLPMPPALAQHVEQGELGVKTGQGFYAWDDASAAALEERMARHLIELLKQDRANGRVRTPGGGDA